MNTYDEAMIFGEEDFTEKQRTLVEPWLQQLKEDYFASFDGTGIHYHYRVHPQERAAVVISHGFCEFVGKYHEVMYYFYQMGYSVFLLEYRGHGFSQRYVRDFDRVHVRNYREYVEDLHSFMDLVVTRKSLSKQYILFGHSMGGCIAALFLEQFPSLFKGAVLSAPMFQLNFKKVPFWMVRILMLWSAIVGWNTRYVPGQKGFDNVYAFETSSCVSEARYAYVFAQRQKEPHYTSYGGTYGWTAASIRAIRQMHRQADRITVPILLFQAGLDTMVLPKGQEQFVAETGRTTLVRYENAKHEIFNADREVRIDYYRRIFSFFQELL